MQYKVHRWSGSPSGFCQDCGIPSILDDILVCKLDNRGCTTDYEKDFSSGLCPGHTLLYEAVHCPVPPSVLTEAAISLALRAPIMLLKSILEEVNRGIAFPTDRSSFPGVCSYIPDKLEDFKLPVTTTYRVIDLLVEDGLVRLGEYQGFTNVIFTFEGRKIYLKSQKFPIENWRKIHQADLCCDGDTIPAQCVCSVKVWCKEHGTRCHGTHD